jgi:hypothetical protein
MIGKKCVFEIMLANEKGIKQLLVFEKIYFQKK